MSDYTRYGLVALVVFLTHIQEGITGFGCTVLALPFIALLLGLKVAVPVLVIQAWVLTLYIVLVSRKQIVWREYAYILLIAGLGFPFGMYMSHRLPEDGLKWVLAIFMVAIGIHGFHKYMFRPNAKVNASQGSKRWASGLLPIGGLIHGAFGSGGPLVVIYATKALQDKSLFRVTLCMVWFTLNTILVSQWIIRSTLSAHILRLTAFCLPFTVIGMLLGNVAHYRMNELLFRRLVYAVLIAAGITLILSVVL